MSARRCQRAFANQYNPLRNFSRVWTWFSLSSLEKFPFHIHCRHRNISELLWDNLWPLEISVKTMWLILGRDQVIHYQAMRAGSKILSLWKQSLRREFNLSKHTDGKAVSNNKLRGKVGIPFIILVFGEKRVVIWNFRTVLCWNKWILILVRIY